MTTKVLLRLDKLFANSKLLDRYEGDEVIFAEGTTGNHMYVIIEGTVDVLVADKIIDVLGPGDLLGEMALIGVSTRSATARARNEVRLAKVDESEFLTMVVDTPFFSLHVMRVLVERLQRSFMRA